MVVSPLCFLIQHSSRTTGTRIVFDLGVRRHTSRYSEPIFANPEPISTEPDVVQRLAAGGLSSVDIDLVILLARTSYRPCPAARDTREGSRSSLCGKVLKIGARLAEMVGARTVLNGPILAAFGEAMADERCVGKDARVVYKRLNESERQ